MEGSSSSRRPIGATTTVTAVTVTGGLGFFFVAWLLGIGRGIWVRVHFCYSEFTAGRGSIVGGGVNIFKQTSIRFGLVPVVP